MSEESNAKLNIAGKLAAAFIHSKLTLLLMIAGLLFGVMALLFTPRTYNPEIIVPAINISISRPGSNAQEMLKQIVRPLEALMASIPGVDHTYGMAADDQALVTVRFKVNEEEENSFVKVYEQISSNILHMPFGTKPPLVQAVSLYDVPIVTLTLSSKNYNQMQLRSYATTILEQLRSLPKVGKSWIAGSSPTALKVRLNPEKLAALYIPLQNIRQALLSNNIAINAGAIESNTINTPLRVKATLINPEDIGSIIVGTYNARPVYLRDVAIIGKAPEDETIGSYFATKHQELNPAVTIALARQKGSNGVEVADAMLKRLSIIQKSLPKDLEINITRNYGADANEAVNTLVEHLAIAIFSIIIILLIFLGWREASIVALSIPIILFLVLGVGWVTGQTINRITLFALILSLGLLVDDSVVVIENIHRHMIHTKWTNFSNMIIAAADEIGRPTIIATFTVMLALLPMGFVSGMMGPFMAPIPFNTLIAMFVSLIIAYTVVPYLAYLWLGKKAEKIITSHTNHKKELQKPTILQRAYIHLFQPLVHSVHKRNIFYLFVGLALILAMLLPIWQFIRPSGVNGPLSAIGVELKMLPNDNVNTFLLEVDAPAGTSQVATSIVTREIANVLGQNKYIKDYQIFLGQAAPQDFAAMVRGDALQRGEQFAQVRVNLIDKHDRSVGSHYIAQQFYASLKAVRAKFPAVKIKLFETPPGPPVRSQIEAAIYGSDYKIDQNIAQYLSENIYPQIYGMINIDNSVAQNLSEYQILVDRAKAASLGLFPENIASDIATYFSGLTVTSMHTPGAREPENIILRLPLDARQKFSTLSQLSLLNRNNQLVALDKIATLKIKLQNKPFYTRDQYRLVYATGEMLYSSSIYAVIAATKKLANYKANLKINSLSFTETVPDENVVSQISWLGEMRLTLDVFRDLGMAFGVALLLIYLLLTGFYRSFVTPIIIMGAIPLTIIGVFPGHLIMHQPFTATSMIGIVALAGIVVRNSLLLIDFIIERQKHGDDLETAVISAAVVRLSPILLTTLAIILGSAIMVSDPVFGGLATSLIFGSLASTLLTLFVIPLFYYGWVCKKQDKAN